MRIASVSAISCPFYYFIIIFHVEISTFLITRFVLGLLLTSGRQQLLAESYSHDQKRGRAAERSSPSTSRTGTPLKGRKTQDGRRDESLPPSELPAGEDESLTHSQVQVVSLAQSSQPVQAAALVVALQALDEAWEKQEEKEEVEQEISSGELPAVPVHSLW